jgi:hypothetical protein
LAASASDAAATVIDFDEFGGVPRLMLGLRYNESHVVANPAHAIFHQRRITRAVIRRAVAALHPAWDRKIAPSRSNPICAGQHGQHTGRGFGLVGLYREDPRMRVRRAEHMPERHTRQHDVVHITSAAPEQPRVLEP